MKVVIKTNKREVSEKEIIREVQKCWKETREHFKGKFPFDDTLDIVIITNSKEGKK